MNGYFDNCDGGGSFNDLYKPKDLRHLKDSVTLCLTAEAPFADWKRETEHGYHHAREAFAAAPSAALKPYIKIEGGRPVTYYGRQAVPQPPPNKGVVESARPARVEPQGEIPLFGKGGPKRIYRTYHTTDPGWAGDPSLDIVYNDEGAQHIPTKAEFMKVSKCTIPNPGEEAVADRTKRSHSARLPAVWKRPNYLHSWMMDEASKDAAVHNSIWRQQKERELQRHHATTNLNLHYERLKGAAVSASSPRYLAAEGKRAEAAKLAERRKGSPRAATIAANEKQRVEEEIERQVAQKPLSSSMRRELKAAFSRLAI